MLLRAGLRGPEDRPTVEMVPINASVPPEQTEEGRWFGQATAKSVRRLPEIPPGSSAKDKQHLPAPGELGQPGPRSPSLAWMLRANIIPEAATAVMELPQPSTSLTSKFLGRVVQVAGSRLHHAPIIHQPARGQKREQGISSE